MSIAELVLLIIAIGAVIAAYVFYCEALKYKAGRDNIADDYHYLDVELHARKQMDKDTKPWYSVDFVDNYSVDKHYLGKSLAVIRNTHDGQYWSEVVIKVFADKDEDYNYRCAEELLEKLRE